VSGTVGFGLSFAAGKGILALKNRAMAGLGTIERLELEIPNLRFPFDVSGGVARFQDRRCRLARATVSAAPQDIVSFLTARRLEDFGLREPRVTIAGGAVRLHARASVGGHEADLTACCHLSAMRDEASPDAARRLRLSVTDLRAYGFLPLPSPLLATALFAALGAPPPETPTTAGPLRIVGACDLDFDPLDLVLFPLLPAGGWRLPDVTTVRASSIVHGDGLVTVDWVALGSVANGRPETAAPTQAEAEVQPEPDVVRQHRAAHAAFVDAEMILARGDVAGSLAAYRAHAARDLDHPFVSMRLLQILVSAPESLAEADAFATAVLAREPNSVPALLARAIAAGRRGDAAIAAATYERLATLAEQHGEPDGAAAATRAAASLWLASPEPARATSILARVLDDSPADARAVNALSDRLAAEGRWRELMDVLRRACLAESETDPAAAARWRTRLASIYLDELQDMERAREELDEALRLTDAEPATWEGLGRVRAAAGDHPGAVQALERADALYADRGETGRQARACATLAAMLESAGDDAGAHGRFRQAASLDPAAVEPLRRAALISLRSRQVERGLDLLEQALARARDPAESCALLHQMASVHRQPGRDAGAARRCLERVVGLDPSDAEAFAGLADLAGEGGDSQQEEGWLARLAERQSDPAARRSSLARRGRALVKLGARIAEATACLEEAAALGDEEALCALRDLHRAAGNGDALRAVLGRLAASSHPDAAAAALEIGDRLLEAGQAQAAEDNFRRAAAVAADPIPALGRLSALLLHKRDAEGRLAILARLVEKVTARARQDGGDRGGADREVAALLGDRAEMLLDLGRPQDAWTEGQRALALDPGAPRLLALAGDAAAQAGATDDAYDAYRRLFESGHPGADDLPRAEIARRLALICEKRQGAAAEEEALRYLEVCLNSGAAGQLATAAWQRIVELHARRGDARAAAAALVASAADARTDEGPRERAARLVAAAEIHRKRLGSAADAAPLLDRAMSLDPQCGGALDALEAIAVEAADWPRAAQIVERKLEAAARRPAEQKALLERLADIHGSHLSDASAARRMHLRVLEIDPGCRPSLIWLARTAWDAGDRVGSAAHYARLIADEDAPPATPAERAESHLRIGILACGAHHLAEAERHAASVLALAPRSAVALDLLIDVLSPQSRVLDLCDALGRRAAVEESPAAKRTMEMRRAALLEEHGHPDQAVQAYRVVLKSRPFDAEALLRLAALHRARGQHGELAKILERLVEICESQSRGATPRSPALADVDPADLYLELAATARQHLRDATRAEIYLLRLLVIRPESLTALGLLTDLLLERGALAEADRMFERRITLTSDPAAAGGLWVARARARLQVAGPTGDAAALEALRAIDPAHVPAEALDLRAELYERQGDAAQALTALREVFARAKATGDERRAADIARRLATLAKNDATGADSGVIGEVFEHMLAADPTDSAAAAGLAALYDRIADLDERAAAMAGLVDRAADALPAERRAACFAFLASRAETAGDLAQAEARLAQAAAADPRPAERADHLASRARVLIARGDTKAATVDLEAALACVPDHVAALASQAELAYRGQNWKQARQAYARLAASPQATNVIARETLDLRRAELADMLGDEAEAIACYRAVALGNPRHIEAREALTQMALYREDFGEAASRLEEILHLLSPGAVDKVGQIRHRLGEIYARLDDLGSARHYLELVVAQDPDRLTALELLADVYDRLQLWPQAVDTCGRLSRLYPDASQRARVLFRQGELLRERLGDEAAANDAYLKSSDMDPHFTPTLKRLTGYFWSQGDFDNLAEVGLALARANDREAAGDPGFALRAAIAAALGPRDASSALAALRSIADPTRSSSGGGGASLAPLAARLLAEAAAYLGGQPPGALDRALDALADFRGESFLTALCDALAPLVAADPGAYGPLRALGRTADRAGRAGTARAAYSLLVFLDPADPAGRRLTELGGAPSPRPAALAALGAVVHPLCDGPLRAALHALAAPLQGLDAPPRRTGGSPVDRGRAPAVAAILESLAARLASPAFQAVTRPGGAEITIEATRPATLSIGSRALTVPQSELVFLVARAIDEVRAGTALVARLSQDELAALLAGATASLSATAAPADRLARAAVTWLAGPEQAAEMPHGPARMAVMDHLAAAKTAGPPIGSYLAGCRHTANRVGLLTCMSPLAAVRALARLEGWRDDETAGGEPGRHDLPAPTAAPDRLRDDTIGARQRFLRDSAALRELVRYIVSPAYNAALGG